ncbi:hypothetical protein [Chamaesiphon minutus]|uniref:Uncharacterized protein n=1 Tax=Chamaesiphon minutus (strain ATCC 27169 / PCC 6605) TaxID=1173020 RepID=K9UPK0_CHAP6|nr:hypothetical protein [Chamaesiphon minutus]AFY97017.1 hypothetical protein Cha6605_6187 [Chamaesiphon minutus PCC 6605]
MSKLRTAWDGVTVECLQLVPDADSNVVVSLAIAHPSLDSPMLTSPLTSHLHLTIQPSAIQLNMAEQFQSLTLPFNDSQTVSDPSILHLLQLLQTEIQVPQLMNQMFVASIVTVLTTHLLRNFQMEQFRQ